MRQIAAVAIICVACTRTAGRDVGPRSESPATTGSIASTAGGRTWSVELPNGWQTEEADRVVTIFRTDGVGALQVSAYFRNEPITDEHLRELAEDRLGAGAVPRPVQLGAFVGFQITFVAGDRFWSQWYVRQDRQALFITYNSSGADGGPEYDEVKRVLGTLKVVHARRAG